ncbi:hypothetical protein [Thalassovita taeanensis]|uniref:hypothetical protein n=1 Tax=Thalassovita taeanensis TaxID=657014 RepID=UPI001114E481|nr:hypothetical protein [Thalassovita taeanensis]
MNNLEALPEQRLDRALVLKNTIEAVATGGSLSTLVYQTLRSEFVSNPVTKRLLPSFVVRCLVEPNLWAKMKAVHEGGGAYAARRDYLNRKFVPLLEFLETGGSAAGAEIPNILTSYDAPAVHAA